MLSLVIFATIWIVAISLLLQNYIRRESLRQIYTLMFTQTKLFYLRYIFLVIALLIASLSLFKLNHYQSTPSSSLGLDIVFVLDVSKSMNVVDIQNRTGNKSRLAYSKQQIEQYIQSNDNNRYGLIIFAGDSISISPLTDNYDRFLTNLSGVNYSNIATQWTNLLTALELGYARFNISEADTGRALVLISDGWDSEDTSDIWIFKDINADKIATQVLGVGTKLWWPIPIGKDSFGDTLFQKYNWKIVTPKLNSKVLKNVAGALAWEYGLLKNFNTQLSGIEKKAVAKTQDKYKRDLNYILVAIASIFFILYLLFPYFIAWRR